MLIGIGVAVKAFRTPRALSELRPGQFGFKGAHAAERLGNRLNIHLCRDAVTAFAERPADGGSVRRFLYAS
eukprot:6457974-Amphidinium_carterae.1